MSNPREEYNASAAIKAAGEILKSEPVRNLARIGRSVNRAARAGGSLTQITGRATIVSRVFIDDSIIDEPVIANLMKRIHEWYAAQCMAAMQLTQLITEKKTVSDFLRPLQAGHGYQEDYIDDILGRVIGQESFLRNYRGEGAMEAIGPMIPKLNDMAKKLQAEEAEHAKTKADLDRAKAGLGAKYSSSAVRSVGVSEHKIGPLGELYELTITNPHDPKLSAKVPLYIQMTPTVVSANVAPRFIDLSVQPEFWKRWTQMRAGEISFWNDFILSSDLARRKHALLKDPAAAKAMNDFIKTINTKNMYALADSTYRARGGQGGTANLANSVMVFSEDTVEQAKADSGIDLHNQADRNRYFNTVYAMSLAIVDPIHQRVTIYFNGLNGELNCSYKDFSPKDSKFDPNEFMTALQAFSSGNAGRMR